MEEQFIPIKLLPLIKQIEHAQIFKTRPLRFDVKLRKKDNNKKNGDYKLLIGWISDRKKSMKDNEELNETYLMKEQVIGSLQKKREQIYFQELFEGLKSIGFFETVKCYNELELKPTYKVNLKEDDIIYCLNLDNLLPRTSFETIFILKTLHKNCALGPEKDDQSKNIAGLIEIMTCDAIQTNDLELLAQVLKDFREIMYDLSNHVELFNIVWKLNEKYSELVQRSNMHYEGCQLACLELIKTFLTLPKECFNILQGWKVLDNTIEFIIQLKDIKTILLGLYTYLSFFLIERFLDDGNISSLQQEKISRLLLDTLSDSNRSFSSIDLPYKLQSVKEVNPEAFVKFVEEYGGFAVILQKLLNKLSEQQQKMIRFDLACSSVSNLLKVLDAFVLFGQFESPTLNYTLSVMEAILALFVVAIKQHVSQQDKQRIFVEQFNEMSLRRKNAEKTILLRSNESCVETCIACVQTILIQLTEPIPVKILQEIQKFLSFFLNETILNPRMHFSFKILQNISQLIYVMSLHIDFFGRDLQDKALKAQLRIFAKTFDQKLDSQTIYNCLETFNKYFEFYKNTIKMDVIIDLFTRTSFNGQNALSIIIQYCQHANKDVRMKAKEFVLKFYNLEGVVFEEEESVDFSTSKFEIAMEDLEKQLKFII